MREHLRVRGSLLAILTLSLAAGSIGRAQEIPDEFHNLRVLDPNITQQALKETMNGFADQLGVKCTFCHDIEAYEKDDLEHKRIARMMIRLVRHMRENQSTYFKEGTKLKQIDCWTCHRGEAEIEGFPPEEEDDDWI